MDGTGPSEVQPAMAAGGLGGDVQAPHRDPGVVDMTKSQALQVNDRINVRGQSLIGGPHAAQVAQTFFAAGRHQP